MSSVSTSSRLIATLVWFRQDLRLQDNPALSAAILRGAPVIPVYILDETGEGRWPMGGASRWWLHHSLAALDGALRARGSQLVLAQGDSETVLRGLIQATGADAVYWNRRYEPAAIARDKKLKAALGVEATSFNATLLFEPHTIRNKAGGPFQVFTPFWKHCLGLEVEEPVKLKTGSFPSAAAWPASRSLHELELGPKLGWDAGFASVWTPGEEGARV
ncbi:MAG TPA: deoxyribodipyrimidine photo-lyase, partial [Lacunisphaera sp.]|nr:deoxyribodipyrimidine photo-lyase [Lacunisphaera sp.]